MARREVGFKGTKLVGVELDAEAVQVAGNDSGYGLEAGDLQEVLLELARRIKELEEAA